MNKFYRKHYTIIEMLVVISILGVLIAMGAPAAIRMMSKQKSTVAKQEIQAIIQAFKAYEAEYGRLPFATTQTTDIVTSVASHAKNSMQLINELLDNSATDNSRQIKFLKWGDKFDKDADKDGGSGEPDGAKPDNWLDPWGNPYIVMIDYDYNGLIEESAGDGGIDLDGDGTATEDAEKLRGSIFVFSNGEDEINGMDTFTEDVLKKFIDEEYDSNEDGDADTNEKGSANSDNVKSW